VGELFRPRSRVGRDVIPVRSPLPEIVEEELRRRLEAARGFVLVCSVCGEAFSDVLEAWLHQERTGHRCFRVEAVPR
jgi:hypothetical protein